MALSRWRDEVEVEDEFTCGVALHTSLLELKPTVKEVFWVTLRIGGEEDGQIWIHLRGRRRQTEAAKLFVIGMVNQEAQEEVQYPAVLHCVFCGMRGFFTNCLTRATSAHILVGSIGRLLISGLAEPVVKAYSFILDLVERQKTGQSQYSEATTKSMQTCRDFKSLVDKLDGSHTLDLLVLPVLVKEVLLDLVKQSGLNLDTWDSVTVPAGGRMGTDLLEGMDKLELGGIPKKPETEIANETPKNFPLPDFIPDTRDHGSRDTDGPIRELQMWPKGPSGEENLLSTGSKQENEHLLTFFTAMGFSEQVVSKVLAHTGPREPSKVLDLIQQEQGKTLSSDGASKEDFMLGVLKKAAATCGYTEDEVDEIYSNLPELSPHELIRELQRKVAREPERPTETKGQARTATDPQGPESEMSSRGREGGQEPLSPNLPPFLIAVPPTVRGPPQPRYPHVPLPNISEPQRQSPEPGISKTQQNPLPSRPGAVITGPQRFLEGLQMPFKLQLSDEPGDPGLRQIIIDGSNVAMTHGLSTFFSCRGIALAVQYFWGRGHRRITTFVPQWRQKRDPKIKEQHFMTQLQELGLLSFTPSREVKGQRINSYDDRLMLQLARQTGGVIVTNDNLRDLVDESVEWKEIIKSRHDLLCHATPASPAMDCDPVLHPVLLVRPRENMLNPIHSIQRLLQYVFAGDLFMVPDDPLGRTGPHIDEFLRAQTRSVQGSHSFAGVTSTPAPPSTCSSQPRAQTDVQQYRERTPGGVRRPQISGRPRTRAETLRIKQDLGQIFQGMDDVISVMLERHLAVTDINQLSLYILEQISKEDPLHPHYSR